MLFCAANQIHTCQRECLECLSSATSVTGVCPRYCRLVGVARVPKVDDVFLKTFLMLPTDALAVMKAELVFS